MKWFRVGDEATGSNVPGPQRLFPLSQHVHRRSASRAIGLKGQHGLAQGNALGTMNHKEMSPERAQYLRPPYLFRPFRAQSILPPCIPKALPWARLCRAFSATLASMIFTSRVTLFFALFTASCFADDSAVAGRQVLEKYKNAVVTVKLVIKQGMSSGGEDSKNEVKSETTGTIIDPSGLTIISRSAIDPSTTMNELYRGRGRGKARSWWCWDRWRIGK